MKRRAMTLLLFALILSDLAIGQQEKPTWKEYTYPADGFAITAPVAPKAHDSPALPGAAAYMMQLGTDTAVVLRAKPMMNCDDIIPRRRENILGGKDRSVDNLSLKDVRLDGHAGLEYQWKTATNTILERWYCIDRHLYILSVNRPSVQPFPESAKRILDSFRLVASAK